MPVSDAQLCSVALLRIGQQQTIDSLEERTPAARACKQLFPLARDVVLSEHWWRFATKRADLALIGEDERSGWDYAFALPADCIEPRYLYPGTRIAMAPAESKIPFDLEHDAATGKQILLTDEDEPELVYTAGITAAALFSPHFSDALAWRLAHDLAFSLVNKPAVGLQMLNKYEIALARAVSRDLSVGREDLPPEAEHIRAR